MACRVSTVHLYVCTVVCMYECAFDCGLEIGGQPDKRLQNFRHNCIPYPVNAGDPGLKAQGKPMFVRVSAPYIQIAADPPPEPDSKVREPQGQPGRELGEQNASLGSDGPTRGSHMQVSQSEPKVTMMSRQGGLPNQAFLGRPLGKSDLLSWQAWISWSAFERSCMLEYYSTCAIHIGVLLKKFI